MWWDVVVGSVVSFSIASAHLHTSHPPVTRSSFPFIHLFYSDCSSGNVTLPDPVPVNEITAVKRDNATAERD